MMSSLEIVKCTTYSFNGVCYATEIEAARALAAYRVLHLHDLEESLRYHAAGVMGAVSFDDVALLAKIVCDLGLAMGHAPHMHFSISSLDRSRTTAEGQC